MKKNIPFNKVFHAQSEESYVLDALRSGRHCGNHSYCEKVISLMKDKHGLGETFLVPSGTAALEMGAVLADIKPGDEVIIPSFTFSSTVNAVVLFGAKPIFCEVEPSTMNIDADKIEALITPRTKMILPIDYAGVPCEIDKIMKIANSNNLVVMHDCAQSYGSYYKGDACGTQAHLATFSFHETKNFNAGEGGALVVNVPDWLERARFIQEKGTDRSLVLCGLRNKYTWVDKGSSYLLSDILAALLFSQLEKEDEIKTQRSFLTKAYMDLLLKYKSKGILSFFQLRDTDEINHHAFWITLKSELMREVFISKLKEKGVSAYIGYLPLHSAPMGISLGYKKEDLPITEDLASRIVRLPFYTDLTGDDLDYTICAIDEVLRKLLCDIN